MSVNNVTNNHLHGLDALRFLAAMVVLINHARNDFFVAYGDLEPQLQGVSTILFYTLSRFAHEAVLVFFVLSGFLVGGRGLEKIINGNFNVKSYSIDRAVRIGIPLVTATILFYFASLILGFGFNWITALGNLLSLQGVCVESLVSPYWSLSYEVWFYILLAAIFLCVKRRMGGVILFVICAATLSVLETRYTLIWFIGAIFWVVKTRKYNNYLKWFYFCITVALCFVNLSLTNSNAVSVSIPFNKGVVEVMIAMSIGLYIKQLTQTPLPTHGITYKLYRIASKFFHEAANFSYTLYLSHRIVFLFLFEYLFTYKNQFTTRNFLLYILLMLITLLVCYGLYFISERHTAKIKCYIKVKLGF